MPRRALRIDSLSRSSTVLCASVALLAVASGCASGAEMPAPRSNESGGNDSGGTNAGNAPGAIGTGGMVQGTGGLSGTTGGIPTGMPTNMPSGTGGMSNDPPALPPSGGCTVTGGGSDAPLIDDFEDGDDATLMAGGRTGFWFVFNDGTGTQMPSTTDTWAPASIPGGRGDSTLSAHTTGSGFSDFGSGLGVTLNTPNVTNCPYDASGYDGVSFWGRGNTSVRVQVTMPATVTSDQGGSCVENCFDTHGMTVTLTDTWQQFNIAWNELSQSGFGDPVTFDPSQILVIQFQILPNVSFDVSIDDLMFAGGQTTPPPPANNDGGGAPTSDGGI